MSDIFDLYHPHVYTFMFFWVTCWTLCVVNVIFVCSCFFLCNPFFHVFIHFVFLTISLFGHFVSLCGAFSICSLFVSLCSHVLSVCSCFTSLCNIFSSLCSSFVSLCCPFIECPKRRLLTPWAPDLCPVNLFSNQSMRWLYWPDKEIWCFLVLWLNKATISLYKNVLSLFYLLCEQLFLSTISVDGNYDMFKVCSGQIKYSWHGWD